MVMMRIILAAVAVLVAAGVGFVTYDWYRATNTVQAFGDPFVLTDHNGAEITEAALRGHPSAVFFGFTHCPEVCPTTLFEMDSWLKQMGEEAEEIQAFFVSVDPERDTPDILKMYVSNVSDRITGITGEPARIAAMAKSFGIFSKKVPLDGGDYTMDHTASVILLDSDGDFFGTIAYGENRETAVAKLKRLAAGS
jgi:protein SCO1/2